MFAKVKIYMTKLNKKIKLRDRRVNEQIHICQDRVTNKNTKNASQLKIDGKIHIPRDGC